MSVKKIVIRAILGIAVIAVLVCSVLFLKNMDSQHAENPTEPLANTIAVYSADKDDLVRLEVNSNESFVLLVGEDGEWVMEGMEGIGVQGAFADALKKSMTNVRSPMLVERDAENLERYGLENPSYSIKLVYSDREDILNIGNASGEHYYFAKGGENDVYIVSAKDLYMFFTDRIKYLDTTLVNVNPEEIAALSYADVAIEKQSGYWFETAPYKSLADESVINARVLPKAAYISAEDIVRKDDVAHIEPERIKYVFTTGEERVFYVHRGDANYSYITFDSSEYAYVVYSADLSFTAVTGFDIITKYPFPIPINEISTIEFLSPMGKTELRIESSGSEETSFYVGEKRAEEKSFRNFYASLMSLTYKGEGTASAVAEYAIIFTKTDGEKTDVRFISKNDTDFAISIDGKTQFTIAKKSVTDVFNSIRNIKTM